MIPAITEVNFPSYATLHQATVSLQDMGDRVISTQVRIDGDVVPDFSGWELRFKGERFVLPSDNPQAMKDNTTRNSLVDLQFQSWAIQELKRYYFFEAASVSAGVAIADKYVAPVRLNVEDFVAMLNDVLDYYFDGKIVADLYLSGTGIYSQEKKDMEINYSYLWEVIGKVFEVYGVRNVIEYDSTNDVYTIKFGYPADEIDDHTFEYGYQGGLLKFERQVQDETISNILLGRGGEKNLPYRYFKAIDPQNPEWAADPDAIPELANIYFDRLRDINFRRYVQGWRTNPNRDTSWEAVQAYDATRGATDWAYKKGHEDEKFSPVEYVKDDESIAAYGEHWGALDDNDEIYPTIQGRSRTGLGRIDEVVAVSPIITDDIQAMAQASAVEKSISSLTVSKYGSTETTHTIESEEFTIPDGSTGNITYAWVDKATLYAGNVYCDTVNSSLVAVSSTDGTELPISGIPAGTYRLRLRLVIRIDSPATSATGTFGLENIVLTTSAQDEEAWKPTFDIWVKDIWGIEREQGESDVQYAMRVWEPILGDRVGNEAKVVFSTGFMAVSEDYEFTIADYPVPDTTKTLNGVPSAWRITLRKSDAEYDATGLYIPNNSTGGKPIAGDKFFFTGIDMPHLYVTIAEEELNTFKSAQLQGTSAVNPTWVISLDKVRVHTLEDGEYGQTLAERLAAGAKLRVTDPRFSGGDILTLYAQSVTYTWNEPSDGSPYLVPDIEVVLSDQVVSRESRVDKIQSSVEQIKSQYARIDDVESVVRKVAEPMFLKKTGEADSSESPTQFSSKVTSRGFRQGGVGGTGWGFYRDNTEQFQESGMPVATRSRSARSVSTEIEEGDSVLEVDRVVVRKEMKVNSLVVNQVEYRGGMEIISAAKIEISKVIDDDANGVYICYFDQRQNSVANNFQVGDIAYGHVFTPNDSTLRYYKCRVVGVDVDRIMLSKTVKDGAGVPQAGDVVVQFGSYTNSARRYVIVRDVVGGGYEQMLSGLDSVTASGEEYYYAGRTTGQNPRWFVGDAAGEYAEWENGILNIKGRLTVRKNDGTYQSMSQYIADNDVAYLKAATNDGTTLVDGGLILSNLMALGQTVGQQFQINAGINGIMNADRTRLGGGIAAWFGGGISDKDDLDPGVTDYAKSIFRFDGSGYLAGGNIHWDDQGYGGIPGITWSRPEGSQNDVITIGANVKLEQTGGTDSSVTDLVSAVQSFPSVYLSKTDAATLYHPKGGDTESNTFKIGGATFTWHPESSAGAGDAYLELDTALVTLGDQIVGSGTPGGGGGGDSKYLNDLLDVTITNPSNGQALVYQNGEWINGSSIPDLSDYYTKTQTDAQISSAITALNLGAAATYGIGSVASGNTGLVTGGSVYSAINSALSSVLKFVGVTTTEITDGSTTNPVIINGSSYTAVTGNVVLYGAKEYLWTGSAWEEMGDEASWALKTITITAGTGLTGGGTLEANRTISLSDATIASLALADSAYQKPAGGIPNSDLANSWVKVGTTQINLGGQQTSLAGLVNLTMSGKLTIGSAEIEWVAGTGGAPGYLKINSALLTDGDQIVGSGTPGGGGGGGASYLYELKDFQSGQSKATTTGTMLMYQATGITDVNGNTGAWKYASPGDVASAIGLGNYVAKSGSTMTGDLQLKNSSLRFLDDNGNIAGWLTWGGSDKQPKWYDTSGSTAAWETIYHSGNAFISNSAITLGSTLLGTSTAPIGWADAIPFYHITTEASITQDGLRLYSGSGSNWAGSVSTMGYAAILAIGSPSRGWQMWASRKGSGADALFWRNGLADMSGWAAERVIYDSGNFVAGTNYVAPATTLAGYGITDWVVMSTATALDSLTTAGVYRLSTQTSPYGSYGNLLVVRGGSASDTLAQVYFPYNADAVFFRRGTTSNFTSNAWLQLYHTGNANKSNVAWTCSTLTASGNATIAGNVGIGTTNPSYRLHVYGASAESITSLVTFENTADYIWTSTLSCVAPNVTAGHSVTLGLGKAAGTKNLGSLQYYYAEASSNSNVIGLGLYSVDYILTCSGAGNVTIGNGRTPLGCKLNVVSSAYNLMRLSRTNVGDAYIEMNNNGLQLIHVFPSSTTNALLSLRDGYGIGIGTQTPAYTLDVAGQARVLCAAGSTGTTGALQLNITSSTNVAYAINITQPNLVAGSGKFNVLLLGGVANSKNNSAGLLFNYAAADSDTNSLGLGFYANDNCLRVIANGCTSIHPKTAGSFNEGIRIHPASNGYSTLIFCNSDNTGDTGTSAKSWSMHTSPNGDFYLNRNASTEVSNYIMCNVGGRWLFGTNNAPYTSTNCRVEIYNNSTGDGIYIGTKSTWATICYKASAGAMWSVGAENTYGFQFWNNSASSAVAKISTTGVFSTSGDQTVSSDINLKTHLEPVKYTIEDIAKTRAVTFDWKDGRGKSAGSIAQDWKPLIPELVHGEEGNMTLAYGQIALVNSILLAKHETEQDKEIRKLKARVRDLEKQLKMRS